MDEKKTVKSKKKLKYTQSAIEYLGLVSWSFVIRCNNAVQKAGNVMVEGVLAPFSIIKNKRPHRKPESLNSLKYLKEKKSEKYLKAEESEQKILRLESSISELEKRLTLLEKSGVTIPQNSVLKPEEKKEIYQESRAILRMLVDDNKRLKNMIKSQYTK